MNINRFWNSLAMNSNNAEKSANDIIIRLPLDPAK